MEEALRMLPYEQKDITTAAGSAYSGQTLAGQVIYAAKLPTHPVKSVQQICGVSVLRSGQCLEKGLRRVVRDAILGSLLIQQDDATGEPLLLHHSLPDCLRKRSMASSKYVILMDSQIGTAAACVMAVRVLLDHGVREDQ